VAVNAAPVTVTTTATLLSVGRERDASRGRNVAVHNPGPTVVYVGGPSVSIEDGFPLGEGADFAADLAGDEALYGIVAADDQECRVLQAGV
jgi:hypothetical protein